MPTMSRPSSVIEPLSGRKAPATRLIVVVLPEPLGPIRPTISPRRRSAENSSTAMMPPKCLCSARAAKYGASGGFILALHVRRAFDTGRTLAGRRDTPVEIALHHREEAILREALHDDERKTEQHETPFAVFAQDLGQRIDNDRPYHGSGQALDAADHRHRNDQAHLRDDYHVRRQDADEMAIVDAGERRDAGRGHEDDDLVQCRVDAARLRGVLVLADRAQEEADARH